jgi:hypothetical protein
VSTVPTKPKKPIYRRWYAIVVYVIVGFWIIGSLGSGGETESARSVEPAPAPGPDAVVTEPITPPKSDPAPAPAPAPDPEPAMSVSQEQAVRSAEDYLDFQAFSKKGLIDQLSSNFGDGFSKADAVFAVNNIEVDWFEQAAKSAKEYLEFQSFSRQGLIDQLASPYGDNFTHAQAVYGVDQTGL